MQYNAGKSTILWDVSPLAVKRSNWTGVARATYELTKAVALQSDWSTRVCASGWIKAAATLRDQAIHLGWNGRVLDNPHGKIITYLVEKSNGNDKSAKCINYALRALHKLRAPLLKNQLCDIDRYFSFAPAIPAQLRQYPKIRCGIFIHDIIPLLFPNRCTKEQRFSMHRILRKIQPNDIIVVNSECTRKDFCEFKKWPLDQVHVVPLAADPSIFHPINDPTILRQISIKYNLPRKQYLLALHAFKPHKNLDTLLKAYELYRQHEQERNREPLSIVLAGGDTPNTAISNLRGVIRTGFIPDADMAGLFANARAFFFPSLYEGFGLPAVEAQYCGVPTFVSDRGSLPEVVLYPERILPAIDPYAWTKAMIEVSENPIRLPVDTGAIRTKFNWDSSAGKLIAALN